MSEYVVTINAESYVLRGTFDVELREQIVRCRDCKFAHEFDDEDERYATYEGKLDCGHFSQWDFFDDVPGSWPVEPDGFCAWGERREA